MATDDAARADYVERFARLLEQTGQSRIGGRIFAHLATSPEPYLSMQELADQLGVSRASVSTNVRRLMDQRVLIPVAVAGSRLQHIAVDPLGLRTTMEASMNVARAIADMADEGLQLQPRTLTAGSQCLRSMRDSYRGFARAMEQFLVRPERKVR